MTLNRCAMISRIFSENPESSSNEGFSDMNRIHLVKCNSLQLLITNKIHFIKTIIGINKCVCITHDNTDPKCFFISILLIFSLIEKGKTYKGTSTLDGIISGSK